MFLMCLTLQSGEEPIANVNEGQALSKYSEGDFMDLLSLTKQDIQLFTTCENLSKSVRLPSDASR